MPKMKSNRSAAKRFKVTGTGKVRRRHAGMRHILSTKARKRKRQARRGDLVAGSDLRAVHRLLPYGF
jgi:large subunit ribosomal protein L35